MQQTVFLCDYCDEAIGKVPHLSMAFQGGGVSGVAVPPGMKAKDRGNDTSGWRVVHFGRNFIHLHVGCAHLFFRNAVTIATCKPVAKRAVTKPANKGKV